MQPSVRGNMGEIQPYAQSVVHQNCGLMSRSHQTRIELFAQPDHVVRMFEAGTREIFTSFSESFQVFSTLTIN